MMPNVHPFEDLCWTDISTGLHSMPLSLGDVGIDKKDLLACSGLSLFCWYEALNGGYSAVHALLGLP